MYFYFLTAMSLINRTLNYEFLSQLVYVNVMPAQQIKSFQALVIIIHFTARALV